MQIACIYLKIIHTKVLNNSGGPRGHRCRFQAPCVLHFEILVDVKYYFKELSKYLVELFLEALPPLGVKWPYLWSDFLACQEIWILNPTWSKPKDTKSGLGTLHCTAQFICTQKLDLHAIQLRGCTTLLWPNFLKLEEGLYSGLNGGARKDALTGSFLPLNPK